MGEQGVMNILITGAKGFVGKNLVAELRNRGFGELMEYDTDTKEELLDEYARRCDFVFHLAGVNRPKDEAEFMQGNFGLTDRLLKLLKKHGSKAPVLITSSIQADLDNPYGRSKKAGEDIIFEYSKETGCKALIYRLPNVFGKWCRPNYNSVVATFCHNIANDLPVSINNPETELSLIYIDDLICELLSAALGSESREGEFCMVSPIHRVCLGELAELLYSFKFSRETLQIPNMSNPLVKKLYSTYLTYLPETDFAYPLKMNTDERGSFTEIIRTADRGQFSVNVSKPGVTKGNHWHHTKNEKFVVVSGNGIIRFRKIDRNDILEYHVSGKKIEVIDIPPGYTHNIENMGDTDMVTFMWCSECFDKNKLDTFFEKV